MPWIALRTWHLAAHHSVFQAHTGIASAFAAHHAGVIALIAVSSLHVILLLGEIAFKLLRFAASFSQGCEYVAVDDAPEKVLDITTLDGFNGPAVLAVNNKLRHVIFLVWVR